MTATAPGRAPGPKASPSAAKGVVGSYAEGIIRWALQGKACHLEVWHQRFIYFDLFTVQPQVSNWVMSHTTVPSWLETSGCRADPVIFRERNLSSSSSMKFTSVID
eukprot:CAMPEP_0184315390 /NCGR_PEP_ID=MMETSP1049-20130417/82117_1 /TAXON_ID=77928 /ORGANISM="Proteomonas sulcata, Strain CCMP704" /LENGTH=105 /DNA_ID=CAMNT_0026633853 /DNA_START=175 /DNA_END=493 /DNA_ORIENTATION=-